MTKKLIGAAAVFVVILGLGAALYFLNKPVETEVVPSSPVEVLYALGGAETKPAKSVEIKNEHGTFSINTENPEASGTDKMYTIAGMETLPVTRSMLSSAMDYGAKIIAKSLISEGGDLAVYGLKNPAAVISTVYADGSKAQLLVGAPAPGNEGHYVTSDSRNVYLVNSTYVSYFLLSTLDFMDKTITAGNSSVENFTFDFITLSGSVREEPIVIKLSVDGTESETSFSSHRITSPMSVDLDTQNGNAALATLYGITATEVADVANTDSVLEKYGLKTPYSSAQVTSGLEDVGNFSISVSEPDSEGMVYAHTSNSKLVYRLPAASLGWLESQVHDLMSKLAILPHIDKVSRVTIAAQSESWVFEMTGEGDELVVLLRGTNIDNAQYRKFYQSLLAASFDSIPDEPLSDNAMPIITYTYEYKDGSAPDIVRFYEGPARKAYIRLNEGSAFLLPSVYLDKIVSDIPKLLNGEAVTSYL